MNKVQCNIRALYSAGGDYSTYYFIPRGISYSAQCSIRYNTVSVLYDSHTVLIILYVLGLGSESRAGASTSNLKFSTTHNHIEMGITWVLYRRLYYVL